MTGMRERLISLIKDSLFKHIDKSCNLAENIADDLLENGVVALPCKVGDKTFLLLEKVTGGYEIVESECVRIVESKYSIIYSMAFDCEEIGNTLECHLEDFERWVFFTREEAERALRKEDEGK